MPWSPNSALIWCHSSKPVGHSFAPSISSHVDGHVRQADLVRHHVGGGRIVRRVDDDVLAPLAGCFAELLGHETAIRVAVHDLLFPLRVIVVEEVAELVDFEAAVDVEVLERVDVGLPQRRVLVDVDVPEGLARHPRRDHVRDSGQTGTQSGIWPWSTASRRSRGVIDGVLFSLDRIHRIFRMGNILSSC